MKPPCLAIVPLGLLPLLATAAVAAVQPPTDPFSFYEGLTDTTGVLKVMMHSPVHTHAISRGELRPDGTLSLVQKVEDEGSQPYVRRWLVRQVSPGHFIGTMSQAAGPVSIDQVGSRYRFRFHMNGGLAVEEWLTPLPGGKTATTTISVHKYGIPVASSEGIVRKIP